LPQAIDNSGMVRNFTAQNAQTRENHRRERFIASVVQSAGILDSYTERELFKAMCQVDRSDFLTASYQARSEEDVELPIGQGRIAPAPSFVARALGLAGIEKGRRVLEIGAGQGYASALMSTLGAQLFAIEQVPLLAQTCRKRLDRLGYSGVMVRSGDSNKGWTDYAPFDVIISWIPFGELPEGIAAQLSIKGGKLIGCWGSPDPFLHCMTRNRSERSLFRFERVDLPVYLS